MENPLVSVIVPTYNSSAYLEGCLASIAQQDYTNTELIIVDNNSRDATKEIAAKYTDKVLNFGPERSAQRNRGVKEASGEYVLIIDSDMHLSKHVVSSCIKEMQKHPGKKALVIPEESFGEGFWAQCKKLERSFYIGVEWMEAARFFPKSIFLEMNGYDEENTGTEDYDLPQRIREKYGDGSIGRIPEYIFHNEQRINLWKTCKKKFYYAQRLDKYQSISANRKNFKDQSNPLKRYALFLSRPRILLKDPMISLGMFFMKTCEFSAGSLGYITSKFN